MGRTERLRLSRRTTYLTLTAVTLTIDAAFVRGAAGMVGLVGFAAAIALLVIALVLPTNRSGLHGWAALVAALVGFAATATDAGLGTVWPRVLVLVFAGLALEADRALLTARAFSPDQPLARPAGSTSLAGALSVGIGLEIALGAAVTGLFPAAPAPTTADGFLVAALSGVTPVHRALIALFFAVIVLILFSTAQHARERAVFALLSGGGAGPDDRGLADTALAARLRRAAGSPGAAADLAALDSLAGEGRRLVRTLITFLPLLGFLGTVIGLATAIAALRDVGPGAAGAAGIAASLSGLAVKFETTLLGLGGALVASALLALLERAEGELAIAATRVLGRHDG